MRNVLKWIGIVLGSLVGLIVLVVVILYALGSARVGKKYTLPTEAVVIPTDAASIERGKHFVNSVVGCVGCHGDDLSGGVVLINTPPIATVYSMNLTSGKGGIGATFTDADFVRAIRHGVRPNGTPIPIMPSEGYYNWSDEDLGDIIAYVKSVPPVDKDIPKPAVGSMGRILLAAGRLRVFAAEAIDHTGPRQPAPAPGATAEYGEYLVRAIGCRECHGPELAGGQPPNPSSSRAPNLTPGGELIGWSEADFVNALRTGVTPGGHALKAEFMPWKEFGGMTDDELKAIWLYLHSLPATPTVTK